MKFANAVGFIQTRETNLGVWMPDIVERLYRGDLLTNIRRFDDAEKVNNDVNVGNRVSIVADDFIMKNKHYIRYVVWEGQKWRVTSIDIAYPRIILTLGGLYNGDEETNIPSETERFS